jgi:hypothetical protein
MIVPSRPLRVNGGQGAFCEKREEFGAAAANRTAILKNTSATAEEPETETNPP